jgi:chromosome segregation ATPase
VEKQQWEEKYHLAAQEVESLKEQGTHQIQQLRSEVAMLRQAGADVETKLKRREASLESLQESNEKLQAQLKQLERDSSLVMQENTALKQQGANQSDEMQGLEQQIDELREHYEAVMGKATELERGVATWQAKYEAKEHRVRELEGALNHGRQEMGQREGNLEHVMAENRKLQEHTDRVAQEHEKQLAEQHKYRAEAEAERQRLNHALEQEKACFQSLKKEAGDVRAQIEAQAMAAMKQREQQLLDEKTRVEEELQLQFSKINQENIELRAAVESLKEINRRKSTEIGRLMATSQEAEHAHQSRSADAQRMQQVAEEAARAKQQVETLAKELAAKESTHAEAIKTQAAEFESQYNDFVAQVEEQFNDLTRENEQLRADGEAAAHKLGMYEGQASTGGEELAKWRTECETLQRQLSEGAREHEALKRELEHRLQELEARNKENAELNAHIQQFLSPDNERTKEVELLQRERQRLEEQNLELQRQMEEIRAEVDARMEEAHALHSRALEEEAAHQLAVQALCDEKEATNRNLLALSSDKALLESQVTSARNELEHWKASAQQLEKTTQELELRLQEVMRQATEQIESQKQSAAMATEGGRTQLQHLTAQLLQRDTQLSEGHQQLRRLQETVRSLEEKHRTQQYDAESVRVKNEQLASQLESLHSEKRGLERVMLQHGGQSGADLAQRLEHLARDMEQRVREESEKAAHLQAVLDSQQDAEQQHASTASRELQEENARLRQDLEEYTSELERLDSELLSLRRDREEQDRALEETQQRIAAHEEDARTRGSASDEFKRLDAVYADLKATYEQLQRDSAAQLKEKESEVAELQDDLAELQSKLDQEKEMTRHLMDRSHADKQDHAKELARKSQAEEEQRARVAELEASTKQLRQELRANKQSAVGQEQQGRVRELEASVKKLQRDLEVSKQSAAGKEQNVVHEKLQKEREHRALQMRCDGLVAEQDAALKKVEAKEEEIEQLRGDMEQLHEEIGRLHDEIRDNTAEMDNARGHLHVSEQLTMRLEEMQDELTAREDEVRQHGDQLAAKEEELRQARGAGEKLKRRLEDQLHEREDQVVSLEQQNAKFREQLKRVAQAKLSSKHSSNADAAAREAATRELEEAYEQSVQREQELASQLAQLEDAKAALLSQFRREMRKLNVALGAQGSSGDGSALDDSAFHRGIMEVSALLRSYQDREARQDALIHRKEKQINELKLRLDELERSSRHPGAQQESYTHAGGEEKDALREQVEAMSEEVARLKVQNEELRGNPVADSTGEPSAEAAREWEDKCARLKLRVRELKDANTKLKERRFSKADVKALVKEVEKLTSQVLEKDMQLQALRNSRRRGSAASAAPTSRRSKDLLMMLREKEDKIMVLNDHLTGLMTENMRLQHSTEQYAVQYGPLDGAATHGVIGNSGIRVPTRANGSRQQPAVRSQ